MEFTEQEIIEIIQSNLQLPRWVDDSRHQHKILDALVTGNNFSEVLIEKIEKIESNDRAMARKRYSKDVRDLFDRVMQPLNSIFSASGGSMHIEIESETKKQKVFKSLNDFKGQKSIKQYLSENYFGLANTDPNGVIFLEYYEDKKIYPTYKSIYDIRSYKSNGSLCKYIIFEPHTRVTNGLSVNVWRVVDSKTDWRIIQNGSQFIVDYERTFEHMFGSVPAVILSDIQEMGSEFRYSALNPIIELAKDYARDKSIRTIYKFQHGFPRHWRYVKECRSCQGTGKTGDDYCSQCNGKGEIRINDVTDITTLPMPREDDAIVTPNLEGYVSPDLETWARYNDDLKDAEELIDSTMWGTRRMTQTRNETATGRFIDVQPVMNKLGWFADKVEWAHNTLANWVVDWVDNAHSEEIKYYHSYGRRFIIESPDVILNNYTEARTKGANVTVLDKLLDEYILSKYQNDQVMLGYMQKKRLLEPYVHNSVKEVSDIFGASESYKKILFVDFWNTADKNKPVEELANDFNSYVNTNQINTQI
jgi:hypothetical protein